MALQLKVQIKGITRPPVWRKVLVPDSFNFRQLHYLIQLVFDWQTEHLYQFQKQPYDQGWCIGESDGEEGIFSEPTTPAKDVNVRTFIERNGIEKFVYVYDFGDDWVHQITVEALTNDRIASPRCLAGKGTPPPENCGGVYGYEELKESLLKDDKDREDIERLEWYGMYDEEDEEPYDINFCDVDEINQDLKHFRSFAKELDSMYDRNGGSEPKEEKEEDDDDENEADNDFDVLSPDEKDFIRKAIQDKDGSTLPMDMTENIKRIRKYEAVYDKLKALIVEYENAKSEKNAIRLSAKWEKKVRNSHSISSAPDGWWTYCLTRKGDCPQI